MAIRRSRSADQPQQETAQPSAGRASASAPPTADPGPPQLPEGSGVGFRQRVDAIRLLDPDAAEQLCLDTVFQYMMTRTPTHLVAQRMGYSTGWVSEMRAKVRERMRAESETMEVKTYLVEMLEQLKEVTAIGFREAATADVPARTGQAYRDHSQRRLKGAEVARNAIRDQVAVLQLAGALDGAPLRPTLKSAGSDPDTNAANVLKDLSARFLSGGYNRQSIEKAAKDAVIEQ